jgi:hypothetical protein
MTGTVLILGGILLLSVVLVAVFTAVVIGIQRADHGHRGELFSTPRHHSDALTRRLLVGVRNSGQDAEENDK